MERCLSQYLHVDLTYGDISTDPSYHTNDIVNLVDKLMWN